MQRAKLKDPKSELTFFDHIESLKVHFYKIEQADAALKVQAEWRARQARQEYA